MVAFSPVCFFFPTWVSIGFLMSQPSFHFFGQVHLPLQPNQGKNASDQMAQSWEKITDLKRDGEGGERPLALGLDIKGQAVGLLGAQLHHLAAVYEGVCTEA